MGAKRCSGQRNKEKASTVEQLAYRFQGFPTRTQEHILNQFIGSVRFLWNRMLGDWIGSYKEKGKSDPIRTPASYKQEPGLEWLKDMDSHSELKLSDRTYICPKCGHVMGRDHQAAINIRNEGMRIYTETHPLAA